MTVRSLRRSGLVFLVGLWAGWGTVMSVPAQMTALQFDHSRSPLIDLFLTLPGGGAEERFSVVEYDPDGARVGPAATLPAWPLGALLEGREPYPFEPPAIDVIMTWSAPAEEVRHFLDDCAGALSDLARSAVWGAVPAASLRFKVAHPCTGEYAEADDAVAGLRRVREQATQWMRSQPRRLFRRRDQGWRSLEQVAAVLRRAEKSAGDARAPLTLFVVLWSPELSREVIPHSVLGQMTEDPRARLVVFDIADSTFERKALLARILQGISGVDVQAYEQVARRPREAPAGLCSLHSLLKERLVHLAQGRYLLTVETRDLSASEWTRFELARAGHAEHSELVCRREVLTASRAEHAGRRAQELQDLIRSGVFDEAFDMLASIEPLLGEEPARTQRAALRKAWQARVLALASEDRMEAFLEQWAALQRSGLLAPGASSALLLEGYRAAARAAARAHDAPRAVRHYREWMRLADEHDQRARAAWLEAHLAVAKALQARRVDAERIATELNAWVERFGSREVEEDLRAFTAAWLAEEGLDGFFVRAGLIEHWDFIDQVLAMTDEAELLEIRTAWYTAVRRAGRQQAAAMLAAEWQGLALSDAPHGFYAIQRADHARPWLAEVLTQAAALGLNREALLQGIRAAIPFTENSHRRTYRAAMDFQMAAGVGVTTAAAAPPEFPVPWSFLQRAAAYRHEAPAPVTITWPYRQQVANRLLAGWLVCPYEETAMLLFPFRDVPNDRVPAPPGATLKDRVQLAVQADQGVLVNFALDVLLQCLALAPGDLSFTRVWQALRNLQQVEPSVMAQVVLYAIDVQEGRLAAGQARAYPEDETLLREGPELVRGLVAYARDLPGGGFEVGRPVTPAGATLPAFLVRVRFALDRPDPRRAEVPAEPEEETEEETKDLD